MTNSELIDNLQRAQSILSEVYDWANKPHSKYTGLRMNSEIARLVSSADSCIWEALEALDHNE
jgi:hypothetical protein